MEDTSPSKSRTLRDAYELLDLRDGDAKTERRERNERFLRIPFEAVPFGEHEIEYRNDDDTEVNFTKELGEAIAFGHLSVATRLDASVVDIESRRPPEPDLRVTFADGTRVRVEVGRITASASSRYFAAIEKINRHLRRFEIANLDYASEIRGRFVSVILTHAPPDKYTKRTADEIISLFTSIDFDRVPRRSLLRIDAAIAPFLLSLGAKYYVGDGSATCVSATSGAHAFNPDESADTFLTMLDKKLGKSYEGDGPLWLALTLTDFMQVPTLSMDAIRKRLPDRFGQFERVIVGSMHDAVVIRNESRSWLTQTSMDMHDAVGGR